MLHELNACARKRNGFQKRKKFIEINTVHTRVFRVPATNILGRHINIVLEKPYYLKDKERNKQKQSNTVLDTYE